MKIDKLAQCFLSKKLWLTLKKSELSYFSKVENNSNSKLRLFTSKHFSILERIIPGYHFWVKGKK